MASADRAERGAEMETETADTLLAIAIDLLDVGKRGMSQKRAHFMGRRIAIAVQGGTAFRRAEVEARVKERP